MNGDRNRESASRVLDDLAETIDVPESKYEEAKQHYNAVAEWLGAEDSELALCKPKIYPQGSFALGTAVRPLGEDEYDVDAVCLLELTTEQVTQQRLKEMVGQRLKHPKSRYKDKIDPKEGGRRCWTVRYADASKFHLDVLPCLPDRSRWFFGLGLPPEIAEHAIRLTDKTTPEYATGWPAIERASSDPTRSNPKGYAAWFKVQMGERFREAQALRAKERNASVEDIEAYEVRTPLQRVVQILKRHRDVKYNGDDDKPISVIITTLAALAYDNEADLYDAILAVVPGMRRHIENRNGVWWVQNPVNPYENFADKWEQSPRKAKVFFEWLDAVEAEHRNLASDNGLQNVGQFLSEAYGKRDASAVMSKQAARQSAQTEASRPTPEILVPRARKPADPPAYPRVDVSGPRRPWKPE